MKATLPLKRYHSILPCVHSRHVISPVPWDFVLRIVDLQVTYCKLQKQKSIGHPSVTNFCSPRKVMAKVKSIFIGMRGSHICRIINRSTDIVREFRRNIPRFIFSMRWNSNRSQMDIWPFIQFTLNGTKQGPMWPAWQGARFANQSVQLIDKIQVITKQNDRRWVMGKKSKKGQNANTASPCFSTIGSLVPALQLPCHCVWL